jgi:hypothetical protein
MEERRQESPIKKRRKKGEKEEREEGSGALKHTNSFDALMHESYPLL